MMPKRFRLLFAAFAVIVLIGGILLALSGPTPETRELAPTPSSYESDLSRLLQNGPAYETFPTETTGVIEGELYHPIQIPEGMKVCAVNQDTFLETCTSDFVVHPSFLQGAAYRLAVPPGSYTVYAQDPNYDFRAYYTVFAQCGIHEECQDHTPLKVSVQAGELVSNIEPKDWTDAPFLQ